MNRAIGNVITARSINAVMGGALVAPWEVDKLDDPTIDAILAVAELPAMKRAQAEVDKMFREFEKQHPTFRK